MAKPKDNPNKLTPKQLLFVENYLQNGFNATLAAKQAGYSLKSAHQTAYELVRNPVVKGHLDERMRKFFQEKTATTDELLYMLSKIVRGELTEETALSTKNGIEVVETKPKIRDRSKAATDLYDRLKAHEKMNGEKENFYLKDIKAQLDGSGDTELELETFEDEVIN